MPWMRLAATLLLLTTSGCVTKAAVRLPVSFCAPVPRPMTNDWIVDCLNAGRLNCVAIQANNGDDPRRCDLVPKAP
jgi:hypothetical protein